MYYTNATAFGASWEGVGITPEARVYLDKSKLRAKLTPEGFYVAPFARLLTLAISTEMLELVNESKASLSAMSGGITGGYQRLWRKEERFSLDLFIGSQFDKSKVVLEGGAMEEHFGGLDNFSGFTLRSGLAVGVGHPHSC